MNPAPAVSKAKVSQDEDILLLESWIEHYREALSRISKEHASTHHVDHITKIAKKALSHSTRRRY